MEAMLWLTKRTVRPWLETSCILPRHFFWNSASPTARTSSTTRISGSRWAATAKARRTLHAAGVALDGGVDELLDAGEVDDLVEFAVDFGARHAEDGAVEVDVFAAGEFGVEAGADFEQGADAAVDFDVAGGGRGDAGEDLEQGAFAGAVAADDADDFAFARPGG